MKRATIVWILITISFLACDSKTIKEDAGKQDVKTEKPSDAEFNAFKIC